MNFKIKYCLPYYNPATQKKYYPTQSPTQEPPTPHLRPHPRSTSRGNHLSRPQEPPLIFFHIFFTSKHFTHAPLHLPTATPTPHAGPTSHLFSHLSHQQVLHTRTSALTTGTTHAPRRPHLSSFFTSVSPASTSPTHLCTYLTQTTHLVQTSHTKTTHNQQHVKKDETCHRATQQ
jgi:hypothetical protein